jgi:hypothetical protein
MRVRLALLLGLAVGSYPALLTARQAPSAAVGNASYTLEARLDEINHIVFGRGKLNWRNDSTQPAAELRFHMYWNAWRDDNSTWMRERSLVQSSPSRPAEDMASIDLSSLTIDGHDLLAGARYIAPDDGNSADRTVLSVPLPTPVQPGQSITVDFVWNAHVPRVFARTGVLGNTFVIAQWFPKIGVLEETGWNCHQFHWATEFFADYGHYDVKLTVPSSWTVGATGRDLDQSPAESGGTTHHFVESNIHDFAWATSPTFVEVHDLFRTPDLPPVDIRLLLQPEHRDQADRQLAAIRTALDVFGHWFGPYPYGHLTVVDPPAVVNPAAQGDSPAGMEYPTLIVGDSRWDVPWGDDTIEDTLVHETAHQFWYGLVGSNEVEHAWMDEGLAQFATARLLDEQYVHRFVAVDRYFGGLVPWPSRDVEWSRTLDGEGLREYRRWPNWDVPATASWRYWPAAADITTYAKTALWLDMLERRLGWPTLQKALASFFAQYEYHHPSPEQFMTAMSAAAGEDLTPFFDGVYRSAATFDYAVARVTSTETDSGAIDSLVLVRRLGDGVFPVDVQVTFDDGSNVIERWDGQEPWHLFRYRRDARVRSAEVDPRRLLLLDVNTANNSWTSLSRAPEAASRWALRWWLWLQNVCLTYAFVA